MARCEPRLSRARAWISSTMSVATLPSTARLRSAVTMRYKLSGVVTRKVGGVLTMAVRAPAVVSPVRTATVTGGTAMPSSRRHLGDLGQWAFQVLVDVDGQRFQGGDVDDPDRASDVLAPLRGAVRRRRWPRGIRPGSCPTRSAPR